MAASQSFLVAILSVVVLVEGGVVRDLPENKIIGGHAIDIADAPWQVFLLAGGFECGGSIISRRWVLTAAHCTFGISVSQLQIRIGSSSKTEGGKLYQVEQSVNHEKYTGRPNEYFNDISLLKTTTRMDLNSPMEIVTLPALGAKRPPIGTKLQVSGWGRKENGETTTFLRAVDVVIRDYEECKDYPSADESTQICAGLPGKDSCKGDSGGPLMKGNLQVGIVSYGENNPCGSKPGAYTDVAVYRAWIKTHTGV